MTWLSGILAPDQDLRLQLDATLTAADSSPDADGAQEAGSGCAINQSAAAPGCHTLPHSRDCCQGRPGLAWHVSAEHTCGHAVHHVKREALGCHAALSELFRSSSSAVCLIECFLIAAGKMI